MKRETLGQGEDKRRDFWHDGGADPPVVLEVPRALAPRSLPDADGDRDLSATPAPGPAARPGALGLRDDPGRKRLPGGGAGGPAPGLRAGGPARGAPGAARVAARRGRQGGPLPGRGRRRRLLRPPAALGAGLVARGRPAVGAG